MFLGLSRRRALSLAAVLGVVAAPAAAQTAPTAVRAPEVTPTALPAVIRSPDVVPYRINAGDEIEVYVWGEERLQRSIRVLPDGTIAMPLVGQVTAQGLLPEQLQEVISKRLSGQYRGSVPQVTVSVRNPSGLLFTVVGKVRSPGSFSPGRYVNLLEALTLAGGPAEFANMDNVLLMRQTGRSITTTRYRLSGVLSKGASGDQALPRVQSGDTIIVP